MKIGSTEYDSKLNKIEFFKSHGYMLPFVGKHYRKSGIIHIGASYYFKLDDIDCAQKQEAESVLENWWDESEEARKRRDEFLSTIRKPTKGNDSSKFGDWVNTRGIIESFAEKNYRERNRAVYREFLKAAYNRNSSKELKNTKGYEPFAYMNFFQKPARNTLTELDDCSHKIVKQVIEILEPKYIVITSSCAGEILQKNLLNSFRHDCEIRFCPHPLAFGLWKENVADLRNFFVQIFDKLQSCFD